MSMSMRYSEPKMTAKQISEETISSVMREMGRKGGKAKVPKGTAALSRKKRSARAKKAAKARWAKKAGN